MPVAIPLFALIFALLAAAIHVYIFALESLWWMRPATRKTFGVRTQEAAETLRPMAYNQGFYNLFLALGVIIGWLLTLSDNPTLSQTGIGMVLLALASMLGAALVLVLHNGKMLRPALIQGVAPAIALLLLFVLG
jgi:putative membrane protein